VQKNKFNILLDDMEIASVSITCRRIWRQKIKGD